MVVKDRAFNHRSIWIDRVFNFNVTGLFLYDSPFFQHRNLTISIFMNFSINNIYYTWGCFMIMTAISWFQKQNEQDNLIIEEKTRND